jgi:asparagine synthase (glutamine-hydrolysing)
MCGLVGIFDLKERSAIGESVLQAMNETQHHRGPDGGGTFLAPGVGLGHRRLSIIDLASGMQPLFSEDRSLVVVFNGEIYNFQDLTAELQEKGHRFRTHSDTEVIIHAWREWGEACVERFRGMFVFALYDERQDCLFIARDRLGIKPLHYAEIGGRFVFASELKGVLAYPGVSQALDAQAVDDYMALGYVPDPKTIFGVVRKLPPGHVLTLSRGKPVAPRQYWDVTFKNHVGGGVEGIAEELIERLGEAVRLRMIADVPLGAFLSGGVDSSAVVAMMAKASDRPVNTCSIGFDEGGYDETLYAAEVARRYGTVHDVRTVATNDFDLIDRLSGMFDEPFADSSAIPTYRVCELARRKVTVALSGDGGDELFAGYRRYRWQMTEERVRGMVGKGGAGVLGTLAGGAGRFLGGRAGAISATLKAAGLDPIDSYLSTVGLLGRGARRALYTQRMQRDLQDYDAASHIRDIFRNAPADDFLSRLQYVDYKTYLPGDILTKVDRTSMAVSLEARVPLLDHLFIGWATGIAPGLRLKEGEGKYIFKKALEPYLPADILYRPKKGFAVPLGAWFKGPLKGELERRFAAGRLADCGLFDMTAVKGLFARHLKGEADHSAALWSFLMFDSFLKARIGERETVGMAAG